MSTKAHFQLLLRTKTCFFDLWFKRQAFLFLLLFYSFNERDKKVIWVTDYLMLLMFGPFFTYTIHMLVVLEKGILFMLLCTVVY